MELLPLGLRAGVAGMPSTRSFLLAADFLHESANKLGSGFVFRFLASLQKLSVESVSWVSTWAGETQATIAM
jgi:hypothetical protein